MESGGRRPGTSRAPSIEDVDLVKRASRFGTESEPPLVALREVERCLEERHTQSAPTQLERSPPSRGPSSIGPPPQEAKEDLRRSEEQEREQDAGEAAAREEQEEREREGRYYSGEQGRDEGAFPSMESVSAALPSPYDYHPPDRPQQQSSSYSFEPWSPVLSSSTLHAPPSGSRYPSSIPNPYEIYSAPQTSPYSYPRELIWSRTQQEQQLALQQRQQREQLQLQLQQQDERYQQEAYQRQQQGNLRLQQSSYGSYPGLSFTSPPQQPSQPPPSSHLYGPPLPSSPEPVIRQLSRPREAYDQASRQRDDQGAQGHDRALHPGEQSRQVGYEQRTTFYDEKGTAVAEGGFSGTSQRYFTESGSPPEQGFGQQGWPSSREDCQGGQQRLPRLQQQQEWVSYPQQRQQQQQQQQRRTSAEMDPRRNDPRRAHFLSSPPPRPRPDLPPPHPRLQPPHHPSSAPYLTLSHLPVAPPPSHPAPVPPSPTILFNPPLTSLVPPPPLPAPSHAHLRPHRTAGETLRSGLPVVPDRSPWAMWAGNVPADATHEELWKFFSTRSGPAEEVEKGGTVGDMGGEEDLMRSPGVESIHLIGRSNCAFVNYLTSAHLQHAIKVCTGLHLRPNGRRCKPLLCRVRMPEDDAKSGVGAQRGSGMHKAYVEAMEKVEGEREEENGGSEEGSTASTASSLFARHFPKRFFILKSHNNEELETSVRTGLWRTQLHNEAVLDQAYRTARDGVYIVFSTNRSREWFGYAKMAGPIPPAGEGGVSWSPASSGLSSPGPMPSMTDSISSRSDVPSPQSLRVDRGTAQEVPSADEDGALLAEARGRPFRVDWTKVQRVPFVRTRHIFNSFNQNREVKISRDGTEIEPVAGGQLLREFWLIKPNPSTAPRSRRPLKSPFAPAETSARPPQSQQQPLDSFGRRT